MSNLTASSGGIEQLREICSFQSIVDVEKFRKAGLIKSFCGSPESDFEEDFFSIKDIHRNVHKSDEGYGK
jgi:hypothetical protein